MVTLSLVKPENFSSKSKSPTLTFFLSPLEGQSGAFTFSIQLKIVMLFCTYYYCITCINIHVSFPSGDSPQRRDQRGPQLVHRARHAGARAPREGSPRGLGAAVLRRGEGQVLRHYRQPRRRGQLEDLEGTSPVSGIYARYFEDFFYSVVNVFIFISVCIHLLFNCL